MTISKTVKLHLVLAVSSVLILGSLLFAPLAQAKSMNKPNKILKTIMPIDPSVTIKKAG